MVDLYSLQMFSIHTYSGFKKMPKGSKQIMHTEYNSNTGFLGKVYKTETGEIVIAFRGTEITDKQMRGLRNDIAMACKKLPAQLQNAFIMYNHVKKEYPNDEIILTGDSLGGTLAALVATKTGTKAVTFAAYGVKDLIDVPKQILNITNIGDTKDPIFMANVNQHIGKVYVIPDKGEIYMPRMSNLKQHGAERMGLLLDMQEYKIGTVKSFIDCIKNGDLPYDKFLNVSGKILNMTNSSEKYISLRKIYFNMKNGFRRMVKSNDSNSGHWVTIDGNHVFIEN